MKKKEKTLKVLTENQLKLFHKLTTCEQAAKWLIQEVMHKMEEQQILMKEMWKQIKKECNIDYEDMPRVNLDEDTGEVYLVTKEYFELSLGGDIDIKKFRMEWNKDGE